MPAGWFADTDRKTLAVFIELHRRMTQAERLAQVFELYEFQQALQEAEIRSRFPNATEREVFLRVAARRLGRELMIKAYNWDPDEHR